MERNRVFDTTKYILITFVVIGHFIEPSRENIVTRDLYCLIYSFHMPLFILISGYFYKQRTLKQEIRKCVPLLEICILSHIGFNLISSGTDFSIKNLMSFGGDPAWYLLSLIYWRVGTGILLKYFSKGQILLFSVIFDFIAFWIIRYGGFLSIERTIAFYPFFMLGYCLRDKLLPITQKYQKVLIICGVLSLVFIFSTSSVLQYQIEFQRASIFELKRFTDISLLWILAYRYAIIICSLLISSLILIIVNNSIRIQKLSIYGKTTLFIYYIQSFMLAYIRMLDVSLLQSLIIAFITIPILTYLANLKISKYIMNPICSTLKL